MFKELLALLMTFLALGQSTLDAYGNETSLGGNLFLVNRTYTLGADYVPNDLVMPDVRRETDSVMMRAEAAAALEQLFTAAKEEENYTLIAVSGYRSYGTQSAIFNRKVKSVGRTKALRFVAPPGASEHQLGLAMDVGCKASTSLNAAFGKRPEGIWLRENCYRFGFILRYQQRWTDITGYYDEPWHIRYVGVEHALNIKDMDIPLEEYIALLRQAQALLPANEKE